MHMYCVILIIFNVYVLQNFKHVEFSALMFIFNVFRDVNVFIFLNNDRFVMKTTTKNQKRNARFKNDRFYRIRRFANNH